PAVLLEAGEAIMRKISSAVALTACLVLLPSAGRAADKETVPAGARLSLGFDKREYFLRENVLIHLVIEDTGGTAFSIEMGGDYRGATRQLRFSVVATDERGKEVPDPDPHQMCLGGLVGPTVIKPGQKHCESLALLRYRRFDRPGTYRLSVSHDFG